VAWLSRILQESRYLKITYSIKHCIALREITNSAAVDTVWYERAANRNTYIEVREGAGRFASCVEEQTEELKRSKSYVVLSCCCWQKDGGDGYEEIVKMVAEVI
jgi:hypothetical protein